MRTLAFVVLACVVVMIVTPNNHYKTKPVYDYSHVKWWISVASGVASIALAIWVVVG